MSVTHHVPIDVCDSAYSESLREVEQAKMNLARLMVGRWEPEAEKLARAWLGGAERRSEIWERRLREVQDAEFAASPVDVGAPDPKER